ncbi:MAG: hypothetical protein WD066_08910 [Planctomycetaceae bacterium]
MPVHDWTRVAAGTFHDFHLRWIAHLQEALNSGLLPPDYYALAEQRAGDVSPDVLTLNAEPESPRRLSLGESLDGAVALTEAPPQVSLTLFAKCKPGSTSGSSATTRRRIRSSRRSTGRSGELFLGDLPFDSFAAVSKVAGRGFEGCGSARRPRVSTTDVADGH